MSRDVKVMSKGIFGAYFYPDKYPDKPQQKCRLTPKGYALLNEMRKGLGR